MSEGCVAFVGHGREGRVVVFIILLLTWINRHHGLVELSSNVGIIDPEDSASERKGMFEGRVGAPKWRVGRRLERNSQFPSFHVDSVQFKNETMDVLFLTMSDPIQPPRN